MSAARAFASLHTGAQMDWEFIAPMIMGVVFVLIGLGMRDVGERTGTA